MNKRVKLIEVAALGSILGLVALTASDQATPELAILWGIGGAAVALAIGLAVQKYRG